MRNLNLKSFKKSLSEIVHAPKISIYQKLKLCMIFCLKYESEANHKSIKDLLNEIGTPSEEIKYIGNILSYAGQSKRSEDIFQKKANFFKKMTSSLAQAIKV